MSGDVDLRVDYRGDCDDVGGGGSGSGIGGGYEVRSEDDDEDDVTKMTMMTTTTTNTMMTTTTTTLMTTMIATAVNGRASSLGSESCHRRVFSAKVDEALQERILG